MPQVSLNTRISPETDKMLREWQKITGKSIASIIDDAIISHLLVVNKDLVMKHLPEDESETKKLKAYQVLGEFGEDYGDIVFAENPAQAKTNSIAHVEHGHIYAFCKARRVPELDQYVNQAREVSYDKPIRAIMKNEIKESEGR